MIVFDLICSNKHAFEGWFASTDEFSRQQDAGMLTCPVCRNCGISKRPSAIHINRHGNAVTAAGTSDNASIAATAHLTPQDLQQVLDYLLQKTEDVGRSFPAEARRIHYGESDKRAIRGQASHDELEALSDEGIEVMALPVPPKAEWH